jgi:hypothetical protein
MSYIYLYQFKSEQSGPGTPLGCQYPNIHFPFEQEEASLKFFNLCDYM